MTGELLHIYGLDASLSAAVVSLLGVSAIAALGAYVERYSVYFSAFAVGLLTVAVLLHLLPEAISESPDALAWVGTGFMVMTLIGIAVHAFAFRRTDGAALTFGFASIIALSAHSMLDGAIYAIVFQEEQFTGWFTISGLLLHEFPEGVIAYFLLRTAGLRPLQSYVYAFLAAGATTVVGTLLANMILSVIPALPLSAMYGAAAGALIYVVVVHLGPRAAKAPHGSGYLAAQFGIALGAAALIINMLAGHGHH